ncbi:MAG TPA: hypothetical protein VI114_05175, partial [Chthoniobacterales bacterium]
VTLGFYRFIDFMPLRRRGIAAEYGVLPFSSNQLTQPNGNFSGLKGHESIALASAWVYYL